jgi:hypothetical protein
MDSSLLAIFSLWFLKIIQRRTQSTKITLHQVAINVNKMHFVQGALLANNINTTYKGPP